MPRIPKGRNPTLGGHFADRGRRRRRPVDTLLPAAQRTAQAALPWPIVQTRLVIAPWPGLYHRIMPRSDRRSRIPNGLAERIDRVRGDEPFEHWVRHQLEASVLEHERELGLVSDKQGDQIERQGMRLE